VGALKLLFSEKNSEKTVNTTGSSKKKSVQLYWNIQTGFHPGKAGRSETVGWNTDIRLVTINANKNYEKHSPSPNV
jgi:hypothetical protein